MPDASQPFCRRRAVGPRARVSQGVDACLDNAEVLVDLHELLAQGCCRSLAEFLETLFNDGKGKRLLEPSGEFFGLQVLHHLHPHGTCRPQALKATTLSGAPCLPEEDAQQHKADRPDKNVDNPQQDHSSSNPPIFSISSSMSNGFVR